MSSSWTPQSLSGGVVTHCRQVSQGAGFALCVLLLAACGQSSAPSSTSSPAAGNTISAVSAPPGADNRPAALGSTGTPKDANGLPVLAPRGVNASQLFAEKLSNSDDRMARLETAVQEMRNDFDAMAPSIVRLVAVEKDIQELVTQLETLVAGDVPAAAAPAVESQGLMSDADIQSSVSAPAGSETGADGAPLPLSNELPAPAAQTTDQAEEAAIAAVTAPAPSPAATPAPAAAAKPGTTVTAIRIGEHPGKTRIVLDVSGTAAFTADLDNGEKILVVDISGASWGAEAKKTFANAPTLASYEVSPGANGGSLLVMKLKTDSAILYKGTMKADSGSGSKIVIDLGRGAGSSVPTN